MPYARTNWTQSELLRLLKNPVHAAAGPHAHSSIHGVSGELASHPMFQHARVMNDVTAAHKKKKVSTKAEASAHSTLDATDMAKALVRALNNPKLQPHLAALDTSRAENKQWSDMKVWLNFIKPVGTGKMHQRTGTNNFNVRAIFLYMKPNPNNADLPIIQTAVPHAEHKKAGTVKGPIIIVS